VQVNFFAVLAMTNAVAPIMIKQRQGTIGERGTEGMQQLCCPDTWCSLCSTPLTAFPLGCAPAHVAVLLPLSQH
jgi:hypothetical protein